MAIIRKYSFIFFLQGKQKITLEDAIKYTYKYLVMQDRDKIYFAADIIRAIKAGTYSKETGITYREFKLYHNITFKKSA